MPGVEWACVVAGRGEVDVWLAGEAERDRPALGGEVERSGERARRWGACGRVDLGGGGSAGKSVL